MPSSPEVSSEGASCLIDRECVVLEFESLPELMRITAELSSSWELQTFVLEAVLEGADGVLFIVVGFAATLTVYSILMYTFLYLYKKESI